MSSKLFGLFAPLLIAGCAAPTSPLGNSTASRPLTTGQLATAGLGGATGAIIGERISGNTGALVGGVVGVATGALVARASDAAEQPHRGEATEQARRDERLRIMQEYWREQTAREATRDERRPTQTAPLLHYPAGSYSGLLFAPRVATDPTLAEPIR